MPSISYERTPNCAKQISVRPCLQLSILGKIFPFCIVFSGVKNLNETLDSEIDIDVGKRIHLFPNLDHYIRIVEDEDIKQWKLKISPWIIVNVLKLKDKEFKTNPVEKKKQDMSHYFQLKQDINGLKKDIAILVANNLKLNK